MSESNKDKVYSAHITLGIRKDGSVSGVYEQIVYMDMDRYNFFKNLPKHMNDLFDKLEIRYDKEILKK